jgi:hypothetical protein
MRLMWRRGIFLSAPILLISLEGLSHRKYRRSISMGLEVEIIIKVLLDPIAALLLSSKAPPMQINLILLLITMEVTATHQIIMEELTVIHLQMLMEELMEILQTITEEVTAIHLQMLMEMEAAMLHHLELRILINYKNLLLSLTKLMESMQNPILRLTAKDINIDPSSIYLSYHSS